MKKITNYELRITGLKTNLFVYCLLFIVYCTVSSCKKKEETTIPEIEFISISPASAVEYVDSITVTFSYDDFNGDLGENDPNVSNLFVTDIRNSVVYNYRISQLSPEGSDIHIKGNLNVVIKSTAITDNSSSQPVVYGVYVKDREGNTSNTIVTSPITITK